ncbi:MAG TPA: hypothetical protein VJ717_00600 [Gemmatimonadaceae bacterium]|nr:hypothetical protein [Gemmatimonadaceae bacterium]
MTGVRGAGGILLRVAAVLLALVTTLLVIGMGTSGLTRPPLMLAVRALIIGALSQLGLYWAATAEGWQRLSAAVVMLPTALIFVATVVEGLTRLVRGSAVNYAASVTAAAGIVVYAAAYAFLVRDYLTSRLPNAPSGGRG